MPIAWVNISAAKEFLPWSDEDIAEVVVEKRLEAQGLAEPLAEDGRGLVETAKLLVGKGEVEPSPLVGALLENGLLEEGSGLGGLVFPEEAFALVEGAGGRQADGR